MKICVSLLQRHAFKNLEMHALLQRRTQNCMRHVSWSPRQLAVYTIFHFSEVLWRRLMLSFLFLSSFPFFLLPPLLLWKGRVKLIPEGIQLDLFLNPRLGSTCPLFSPSPPTTLLPTLSSQLFLSRRFLRCTLGCCRWSFVLALSELLPPSPASRSSPGQWPRVWNHATHRLRILGYCSLDNNCLPVVPVFTDRWQAIHLSQKLAGIAGLSCLHTTVFGSLAKPSQNDVPSRSYTSSTKSV